MSRLYKGRFTGMVHCSECGRYFDKDSDELVRKKDGRLFHCGRMVSSKPRNPKRDE